jgi:hypothetical protein
MEVKMESTTETKIVTPAGHVIYRETGELEIEDGIRIPVDFYSPNLYEIPWDPVYKKYDFMATTYFDTTRPIGPTAIFGRLGAGPARKAFYKLFAAMVKYYPDGEHNVPSYRVMTRASKDLGYKNDLGANEALKKILVNKKKGSHTIILHGDDYYFMSLQKRSKRKTFNSTTTYFLHRFTPEIRAKNEEYYPPEREYHYKGDSRNVIKR